VCARFQCPYDLRVLAAAAAAPFNVMHVCQQDVLFDAFADYPVAAFSWALGPHNPGLADGHRRTGKASMGGIPNSLDNYTPRNIGPLVSAAIEEMDGRWLVLAPYCSIDIATSDELLLGARNAARISV
jgi:hypothetical protein